LPDDLDDFVSERWLVDKAANKSYGEDKLFVLRRNTFVPFNDGKRLASDGASHLRSSQLL
jgi:hypothetical protein